MNKFIEGKVRDPDVGAVDQGNTLGSLGDVSEYAMPQTHSMASRLGTSLVLEMGR